MQKTINLLLARIDAKTIRQELHAFLADRKGNGTEGERSDQSRTFVVNQTVSCYARFVIRSFVAWEVLKDTEAKGCYEKAAPVIIADANLAILIFESAILPPRRPKECSNCC